MIKTNNNLGLNNNNRGVNNMNIVDRVKANKERNMAGLYDGAKSINKNVIEAMGQKIDCVRLENKQKALAVMSYSYGSLVGVTTTGVSLGLTVLSNPGQYFDAAGVLDINKIRKAFKHFGENVKAGKRYESVFVSQVNKDVAVNKFGRVAEFVRVSAHEVREFDKRIRNLDHTVVTVEDLHAIAKDLDIIGRAMQELAIDVTKDKSKDIGYNIMSLVEVKSKTLSRIIKAGKFTNNIDNIVTEHFNERNIKSKYNLVPEVKVTLANADTASKSAIANSVVEDISGEMMESINAGYVDGFQDLIELFKMSHNDMYNRYIEILEIARKANDNSPVMDKKIAHMVRCARVALYSINSLYGAKNGDASINSAYVKEVGKKLRAGLYTEGAKIGFKPYQVVVMATAAAFCHLNGDQISKKKVPSLTELWAIFPREFVIDYVGGRNSNRDEVIKDMLTVKTATYDLCLNDELVFDEGMAETEYGFVVVAENYTGKAIVTKDGIEAVVDHYAYEPTEVMFLDAVYSKNVAELNAGYKRPTTLLAPVNEDLTYNANIVSMVRVAEQYKVATCADGVKDFVIKKGNKISIIGKVLSFTNTQDKIKDAIVSSNGAVIFFN